MAKKKTAKQLEADITEALAAPPRSDVYTISARRVYSRSAQMPTVSGWIAALSSLYGGRDVQFKRETRALAIRAALKYAAARNIHVANRALIEARLQREGE